MPVASGRPIRAVIFDIGGILEPSVDEAIVPEVARMLGVTEARLRERRAAAAVALTDGRLTLRDFYARLAADTGTSVDPDHVVARHVGVYGAGTVELDGRVLALIERLRRRHAVACLSNTEIEVARFNRDRGLFRSFDRAFLSTELGLHKPERAIFERALRELGCAPAEAVFTDDKLDNVVGAKEAGMHAIHYQEFEAFSAELATLTGQDA